MQQMGEGVVTYFIVKVRDATKRQNSKPVEELWWDAGSPGTAAEAVSEVFNWNPSEKLTALQSMTIEARPMTKAEAEKWDRMVDREARRNGETE